MGAEPGTRDEPERKPSSESTLSGFPWGKGTRAPRFPGVLGPFQMTDEGAGRACIPTITPRDLQDLKLSQPAPPCVPKKADHSGTSNCPIPDHGWASQARP